mgnify:CR=1 FL=1
MWNHRDANGQEANTNGQEANIYRSRNLGCYVNHRETKTYRLRSLKQKHIGQEALNNMCIDKSQHMQAAIWQYREALKIYTHKEYILFLSSGSMQWYVVRYIYICEIYIYHYSLSQFPIPLMGLETEPWKENCTINGTGTRTVLMGLNNKNNTLLTISKITSLKSTATNTLVHSEFTQPSC